MTSAQSSDAVFEALADPTRRAILAQLAQGEATVTEIAAPFAMSQPAISQHLKVLQKAGLIARRAEGTKRPCRLNPEGLTPIDQWLDALRRGLARNYERLDAVLAEMTRDQKRRRRR
jgi:DNA-binding transcriptional ArsR family regulator